MPPSQKKKNNSNKNHKVVSVEIQTSVKGNHKFQVFCGQELPIYSLFTEACQRTDRMTSL